MSSVTKQEYIDELQSTPGVLASLDDSVIDTFVDRALRLYSGRLPKVKMSVNNAVVSGQELYDFPTGAVRIVEVRTTAGQQVVVWTTEDQGSGTKIKLGAVKRHSYEELMSEDYYSDPLNTGAGAGGVIVTTDTIIGTDTVGYEAYDVEFAELQTIPNISDSGLEILTLYVEYLALNAKANKAAEDLAEGTSDTPASITDTSSDGSGTTIQFDAQSKVVERLEQRAETKLEEFNRVIESVPYGTRG